MKLVTRLAREAGGNIRWERYNEDAPQPIPMSFRDDNRRFVVKVMLEDGRSVLLDLEVQDDAAESSRPRRASRRVNQT